MAVPIALAIAGCAFEAPAPGGDGGWVGTITTEGNTTTVVNEAGSVWDGPARLVEEASIGVASGADEYMFGTIYSVYATDDRIYVADAQVPAVRAYDHGGTFVGNLGRPGQGPGEYQMPTILAADGERVFVLDGRLGRINVYGASGEVLGDWPLAESRCCAWPMYPLADDALWVPVRELDREARGYREGVQAVGPSGPYGEVTWIPRLEYERATVEVEPGFEIPTPLSAWLLWNPASGGRILVGAADRYRFEIHGRDGSRLVVERYWEPLPVPPEQKEWLRRQTVAERRRFGRPGWVWDGSQIPDRKPAYSALVPALSGETWVARYGESERHTECAEDPIESGHDAAREDPCWTDRRIIDAFGADGRYLGEVEMPPGIRVDALNLFIDGRRVVARLEDEEGTIRVKRYRLVLPGE